MASAVPPVRLSLPWYWCEAEAIADPASEMELGIFMHFHTPGKCHEQLDWSDAVGPSPLSPCPFSFPPFLLFFLCLPSLLLEKGEGAGKAK